MTELARKLSDAPKVSDTIKRARARGLELVSDNLPRVADATDRAGRNIADFIRSSTDNISGKVRQQKPSTASRLGSALGASWLLRGASRLVTRHPVALLVGGAAIAAVGVAAWRLSQPQPADALEPEGFEDDDVIAPVAALRAKTR